MVEPPKNNDIIELLEYAKCISFSKIALEEDDLEELMNIDSDQGCHRRNRTEIVALVA